MILGVDPGLAATGWGVIDAASPRARYMSSGVIRTAPSDTHVDRLARIGGEIADLAREWKPETACVERVFVGVNPKSSMVLGEARGAIIAVLCAAGVKVMEISALQVKKSVTGLGLAGKGQVAQMLPLLLQDVPDGIRGDAADALACALALTPLSQLHDSRLPPVRRTRRRRARR